MLTLQNIDLAFGHPPLLQKATLAIRKGDRLALIGRNGSGKSSLLKILAGVYQPDGGEIIREGNPRIGYLPQEIPTLPASSVSSVIHAALAPLHIEDWQRDTRIEHALANLEIDGETLYANLSFGLKRRVLLAAVLATEPDLLLLDEPTNHLDVQTIAAMEANLLDFSGALLFITHDRAFLQRLASAIIDLDRAVLTRYDCDYPTFLQRKADALEAEARQRAVFDKKLAEEEAWIRRGIKARRTRNEGRVRNLLKLREEHLQRRERAGTVQFKDATASASGHKVITAEAIVAQFDGAPLFAPFSCEIVRGDRLGIVGPNGCGKSTLVSMLIGQRPPDSGTVSLGTNLQIAWFDQNREQLDPNASVFDNVADGNAYVVANGEKRHVMTHLKDFLFTSEQARGPITNLSGGERNRLLLARLFTRPFNVLVLDEPTNDLDLETLELLEDQLAAFTGTLILISHDRAFLNAIVTELAVFEPDGHIRSLIGDFDDYQRFLRRTQSANTAPPKSTVSNQSAQGRKPDKPRRFLNRERRELDAIPQQIEALEAEQADIAAQLADPNVLRSQPDFPAAAKARLDAIELSLAGLFERWEALETLRAELEG